MKLTFRLVIILFSILLFKSQANCQESYPWNRKDIEADRFVNLPVEHPLIDSYVNLLNRLSESDQIVRRRAMNANTRENGTAMIYIDSVNSELLIDFFSRFGIPTLNKINIPDDSLRKDAESDRSLLFLHYIVNNCSKFFELMEMSVLSKISNMNSLNDLTATYLYRITEFKFDDKFFCVPLPNVSDSVFGKFYIRSIVDFLSYYFESAKRGQRQYFICRNPFSDIPSDSFIKSTILINEQFEKEGLTYHSTIETIFLNVVSNFEYYKLNLINNKSDYMIFIYADRDNKGWTDINFE